MSWLRRRDILSSPVAGNVVVRMLQTRQANQLNSAAHRYLDVDRLSRSLAGSLDGCRKQLPLKRKEDLRRFFMLLGVEIWNSVDFLEIIDVTHVG